MVSGRPWRLSGWSVIGLGGCLDGQLSSGRPWRLSGWSVVGLGGCLDGQ